MRPHHLFMGRVDARVVMCVYVPSHFDAGRALVEHALQDTQDVVYLELNDPNDTSAMAEPDIGTEQREEIREAGDGRAEVCACVFLFPKLPQDPPLSANHLH